MNFAILAPSPHRFVMGGAEHFYLGLQRYINECTEHTCELIKVPTSEGNLMELVRAYRMHAQVDLSGYDRVISCKYPAWMVRHPQHSVYMLHTLRGLYDTYHFTGESLEVDWTEDLVWLRQELDLLRFAPLGDNSAALRLLDMLEIALDSGRIDPHAARFPGPLSRHVIQALDRYAMQPARIRSYTAISRTVAARSGYFPDGVSVGVAYPPPRLEDFRCLGDDYFFTVSRLDGPKRIGLLIEAMRHVRSDIPLLIGGTGPDESRLRELAQGDPRVRFLGAMTDEQLLDAYANALAVPFVPYDEDYGLITIEAMRSGKPVLTVSDAGGVTEFVENGITGLCVPPESKALGAAMDELCTNRSRTRSMGVTARRRVESITWQPLAEAVMGVKLLNAPIRRRAVPVEASTRRLKVVVAITFPATPPRGGGQSRVFHLYKALARSMDVVLICLCDVGETEMKHQIAPGMWEVRVPKSAEHQHHESEASRLVDWVPVTDIVASRAIHLTPSFSDRLDDECQDADVVVACHPFFAPLLRERYPQLSFWFEAQDVELTLKESILPKTDASRELLDLVRDCERRAWTEASVVYACADRDLETMFKIYGDTQAWTTVIPNGFSEEEVQYVGAAARAQLRSRLALDGKPLIIFLGSWHGPNLEAVERIVGYAEALPDVTFAVIGSAALYVRGRAVPTNLRLLGPVDEAEKQVLLSAANLAINPMSSGTGSNLKMLDYFAAGVPVMSTTFGARGIDALPDKHFIAASLEGFIPAMVQFLLRPPDLEALCQRARDMAHTHYSWSAIGQAALPMLRARV